MVKNRAADLGGLSPGPQMTFPLDDFFSPFDSNKKRLQVVNRTPLETLICCKTPSASDVIQRSRRKQVSHSAHSSELASVVICRCGLSIVVSSSLPRVFFCSGKCRSSQGRRFFHRDSHATREAGRRHIVASSSRLTGTVYTHVASANYIHIIYSPFPSVTFR
jgi:hypothetical protein